MPGEQEALRVNVRAERLREPEDDTARQRSPQTSSAADNSRFECENELQRARVRIEIRSQRQKQPGEPDGDQRNRRSDGVDEPGINADQLYRVRIFCGRANLPSQRCVGEK